MRTSPSRISTSLQTKICGIPPGLLRFLAYVPLETHSSAQRCGGPSARHAARLTLPEWPCHLFQAAMDAAGEALMTRVLSVLAAAMLALAGGAPAVAQTYPDKPIRV